MTSDPNRKSARTFQCRDVLWDTFEQMARELECSVDYLINESMKQYARQRSYGSRTPYPGNSVSAPPPNVAANNARRAIGSVLPPPPARPRGGPPPLASRGPTAPMPPAAQTLPPVGGHYANAPAPGYDSRSPSQQARGRSVPPPVPSRPPPGFPNAQPQQPAGQLSLICNNEKVTVDKDRFIVGRGKQSSDYTLKDPNVSRQHAMIEYQNGAYFFVDMGSTNGIEFNGQRVARKQINEGDSFKICDHEIRFTYR